MRKTTQLSIISLSIIFTIISAPVFAKKKVAPAIKPIVVQTTNVQFSDVPIYIDALGSLTAEQSVTITTETDGRIAHIFFSNGQQVGKNMPIIQQDNSIEQANYNIAVTSLNLDRSILKRWQMLPPGTMSAADIAKQKAQIDTDQATVQLQQATLNQKTLTAPFDGVLGNFQYQVGDYVKAGTAVVTLNNSHNLLVNFSVQQAKAAMLKNGQQIKFEADAFPHKLFYGTVTFISPTVDVATRTIGIQALFQNKKDLLAPGMFVHAEQQVGTQKHAMLIPDTAISADIKGYYVYRDINNRAIKTYIQTGTHLKDLVEVTKGLTAKDIIVSSGIQKLEDGSIITVLQPKKPTSSNTKTGA